MKNNDDNSNVEKGNIYKPIYYGNWEEKILYDLAIWKNGLAFKNINFTDSGKPVIKIAELKNGITAQTKFTQDVFDDSVYLKKGDMLFSWSGNPETSIDVFYYNLPDGWLNQHIFKIQTKDSVFYRYFFYILKYLKPNFIAIATNKQTTGLGHVTINDLKKLKIKLPPLEEQKKIASVLSSLDDKIELNNRMNKILEEMAQTIFKEWFVNFNFPNEDGKPYKDSGGKMIESELGAIPEGWKVGTIGDIAKIVSGKRPPKQYKIKNNEYYIPIYGASSIMGYTNSLLYNEKILITGRVGTHGIIQRVKIPCWASDNTLIITSNIYEYTYQNLKNVHFHLLNRGSTQPLITQSDLKNIKIIIADNDLISKFEKYSKSLFDFYDNNNIENEKLASIRDTLLPKLMSGEIKIK